LAKGEVTLSIDKSPVERGAATLRAGKSPLGGEVLATGAGRSPVTRSKVQEGHPPRQDWLEEKPVKTSVKPTEILLLNLAGTPPNSEQNLIQHLEQILVSPLQVATRRGPDLERLGKGVSSSKDGTSIS